MSTLVSGDQRQFEDIDWQDENRPKADTVAAHVMVFARTDKVIHQQYPLKALVMMHLRSDGAIGFPGGIVEPGESVLEGAEREFLEETGSVIKLTKEDHICSQVTNRLRQASSNSLERLELHFFAKELCEQEYIEIETKASQAQHFGVEVFGMLRAPVLTYKSFKGLPMFLHNRFSGNSKIALLKALEKFGLRTSEDIEAALKM